MRTPRRPCRRLKPAPVTVRGAKALARATALAIEPSASPNPLLIAMPMNSISMPAFPITPVGLLPPAFIESLAPFAIASLRTFDPLEFTDPFSEVELEPMFTTSQSFVADSVLSPTQPSPRMLRAG